MIIYKLKFLTSVHFGTDSPHGRLSEGNFACHADTFFSAICQEWIRVYGLESMEELINAAERGDFRISDLFPFNGEELYVPKPVLYVEKDKNFETSVDKKRMKKIKYVPITSFQNYIEFLKKGGNLPFDEPEFGEEIISKRVNLREDKSLPYTVSSFRFNDNAGLYFMLEASEELQGKFENVIASLETTGLGGKKTSGMGKFEQYEDYFELGLYDSDIELERLLGCEGDFYMALSVVSPSARDIENINFDQSYYSLIHRTGFVDSCGYSENPLKKKEAMFFNSGSCFNKPLEGSILDVSNNSSHKVYRYGKGMFLGVKI